MSQPQPQDMDRAREWLMSLKGLQFITEKDIPSLAAEFSRVRRETVAQIGATMLAAAAEQWNIARTRGEDPIDAFAEVMDRLRDHAPSPTREPAP